MKNICQNLKVDILSRIVNFPKFVSPTTKNSYPLKSNGTIRVKKASNGTLGAPIRIPSKIRLILIRN